MNVDKNMKNSDSGFMLTADKYIHRTENFKQNFYPTIVNKMWYYNINIFKQKSFNYK